MSVSIKSVFLWEIGFSLMNRNVLIFSLGLVGLEARHCRGNLSVGRRSPVNRTQVLDNSTRAAVW